MYYENIEIKELRKKAISMLIDVKESLDKWGVIYWLDFGSLLGAVRDGQSIIWDGDFDLSTLDITVHNKNELWDELVNKGYEIDKLHTAIGPGNIKIRKKDWNIGNLSIDLHTYHINQKGDAEYQYGDKYIKNINIYLEQLLFIVDFSNKEKKSRKGYPNFSYLCRTLLKNGIRQEELERLPSFKMFMGKSNYSFDFKIEGLHKTIISSYKQKINKSDRIILNIIKNMPIKWRIFLSEKIRIFLNTQDKIPIHRVYFPINYFKKLDKIEFHNMKFNTPNNPNQYLERIYGEDWMIPKAIVSKSYLNKISYK